MTLDEMKQYIFFAKETFPRLTVVVFTGGECTLLGDDLYEAITFAKSLGLITRIVTNGHWADNHDAAVVTIDKLVNAGLDEINFSTGAEHETFVSFNTISYAVSMCAKTLQFSNVLISMELSPGKIFDKNDILNSLYIKDLDESIKKKIICIASPWVEFRKHHKDRLDECEPKYIVQQRPCREIFETININPSGQFLACCGLACEYSPFLKLGKITNNNIKLLHEARFNDILKLWLYVKGPYSILEEIGLTPSQCNKHGCEYCLSLLKDLKVLNKLLNLSHEQLEKVLIDYNLTIKRDERNNKTSHS